MSGERPSVESIDPRDTVENMGPAKHDMAVRTVCRWALRHQARFEQEGRTPDAVAREMCWCLDLDLDLAVGRARHAAAARGVTGAEDALAATITGIEEHTRALAQLLAVALRHRDQARDSLAAAQIDLVLAEARQRQRREGNARRSARYRGWESR